MKYNTYIFDLDGTLLSTLGDLAASCNYALRSCGMPERSLDEVRQFVGNGVKMLMIRAVPGGEENADFEKAYATFRYPGIMDMLKRLSEGGAKLAVVSNKFYAATQELVAHFFGDYVKVAIGEREQIRKKPAPDTVIEALRQLGADANSAVYIGDSDVDIDTARAAGMPCISVLWGFRDKDFLIQHGAETLVESPEEIV